MYVAEQFIQYKLGYKYKSYNMAATEGIAF